MPRCSVAWACGSRSMRQIRMPVSASAALMFTAVVVFPTPPFWFMMAIERIRSSLVSADYRVVSAFLQDRLSPRSTVSKIDMGASLFSDGALPGFTRANTNDIDQIGDEHLAVANLARLGVSQDQIEHQLKFGVGNDHLDLKLGNEVHLVLRATIHFQMALLP